MDNSYINSYFSDDIFVKIYNDVFELVKVKYKIQNTRTDMRVENICSVDMISAEDSPQ